MSKNYNNTLQAHNDSLYKLVNDFKKLPDAALKLQNKTFTENGVYAADSNYDGLGTVTVNLNPHKVEDSIVTRTITDYTNSRVTNINNFAFANCTKLRSVNFPLCSYIGKGAFYRSSLKTASFPMCRYIDDEGFEMSDILSVSFPLCSYIGRLAFGATALTNLTLENSSVANLANINAFTNTPMSSSGWTGSFGSIYVPRSLVNTYKTATNWVAYADRITYITTKITFMIDNVRYQAEKGMTWEEWCNSDYNIDHYTCNTIVQSTEGNRLYNESSLVFASDIIVEEAVYTYSLSDGQQLYLITYDLSDAILSNVQQTIKAGESYITTLTTKNGYPANVIITMNNTDITNTAFNGDATISIAAVTGDITITVTEKMVNFLPIATDTDRTTIYNKTGYYNGMRWSKSGGKIVTGNNTTSMTGFIPCKPGDTLRIYSYTKQVSTAWYVVTFDGNQKLVQCIERGGDGPSGAYESPGYKELVLDAATYGEFTDIRLSWGQFDANSIITINQEIPAYSVE